MKFSKVAPIGMVSSMLLFASCEKGGSNFSILSTSSQYQQASTYVPRQLDVLFVIDNSGSMSSSQANLATNFPSFINYFKDKGYDYHIGVATSDAFYGDQFVSSGCSLCNLEQTRFKSGTTPKIYVIDNQTLNLETVFAANVNVGTGGSGDERAFSSFKAALTSNLNSGFRRASAYLAVIIVSDEEDFSHNSVNMNENYSNPGLHTVASYKTFLEGYTSGVSSEDFSVSTISILDSACRTALGAGRKIGTRYMQLADLTGGTKNSICQNFNGLLDNISNSIANQIVAQFALTRIPQLSSIRVLVDGILLPNDATHGWSYDSASNTITIKGTYTPQAGAVVTINFDPATMN